MGFYLNTTGPATMYQEVAGSPYFVDKTALLAEIAPLIESADKYICITRPRRFGKTVTANMITAYFSNASDTTLLFDKLDISNISNCGTYQNQYPVIHINFSEIDDSCRSYSSYIDTLKSLVTYSHHLIKDLKWGLPVQ